MDKDLLYNQSGIKDETAYKAITNLRSGSRENMNGYEINKGEIWEVQRGEGAGYVVILACFERYAATVILQEQKPSSNAVPVRVQDIMYADAGRVGWIFYDKMVDYVRTLSTDEDRELRKAIGEALDLEVNKVSAATIAPALEERDKARDAAQKYENMVAAAEKEVAALRQELKAKTEELEEAYDHMEANAARVDELEDMAAALSKQLKEAPETQAQALKEVIDVREDLAAARREAEIYKDLYEKLLARALG